MNEWMNEFIQVKKYKKNPLHLVTDSYNNGQIR